MKILLLTHTFNCLCQRVFLELERCGHQVSIEFDIEDSVLQEALDLFAPNLIIAPFLKRAIPASVWSKIPCIIIHPGIVGDKGPSSLDWAILNGEPTWGVTALQASASMDGGDVWAHTEFVMREGTKSSLYRNEVTDAAVKLVHEVVFKAQDPLFRATPLVEFGETRGCERPLMKQKDRAIVWERDTAQTVLRKVRSGDGSPGVLSSLAGRDCYLFGAFAEQKLRGHPGEILATRDGAVCVACLDGAVWITHLQERRPELKMNREAPGRGIKLPAVDVLKSADSKSVALESVPEFSAPFEKQHGTWQEICVEKCGDAAYLFFEFSNGAMSVAQSNRLRAAFCRCCEMGVRVVVLMGGRDFWSNGIHLNQIESAASAADASWENIRGMNCVAREILEATNVVTVAALRGNVGSGGCFLALACDYVWAREGVVLNPHYKNMGNLYGSEYWTYVLPRRMGMEQGKNLMRRRLPVSATEAKELKFLDDVLPGDHVAFCDELQRRVQDLMSDDYFETFVADKKAMRAADEAQKPLDAYEREELEHMRRNFYGFDPSYHVARYNFVFKIPHSRTPLYLAKHRC